MHYAYIYFYSFKQNGPKYCHLCPAAAFNNSSNTNGNHKKFAMQKCVLILWINKDDMELVENIGVNFWKSPASRVKLHTFVKGNCLIIRVIPKRSFKK